jgi:hypothetical protein
MWTSVSPWTEEGYQPVFFEPRALRNLHPIDEAGGVIHNMHSTKGESTS